MSDLIQRWTDVLPCVPVGQKEIVRQTIDELERLTVQRNNLEVELIRCNDDHNTVVERAERAESDREQLRAALAELVEHEQYHAISYTQASCNNSAVMATQRRWERARALSEPQAKEGKHADTLPDRGDVLRSWDAAMKEPKA
jgi:hypothetical protein